MITITASDGTVTTMTEQEFLAARGGAQKPARRESLPRRPREQTYSPRANGVEGRFDFRRVRRAGRR